MSTGNGSGFRPPMEATQEDLREILIRFWLDTVGDTRAEFPEKIKASELLAKYILGSGKTSVSRRSSHRPATAEVLLAAEKLEHEGDGSR